MLTGTHTCMPTYICIQLDEWAIKGKIPLTVQYVYMHAAYTCKYCTVQGNIIICVRINIVYYTYRHGGLRRGDQLLSVNGEVRHLFNHFHEA